MADATQQHPLRQFRAATGGMSQADLARLLNTTSTTIHRWETGLSTPRRSKWGLIQSRTGIKPDQIVRFVAEGERA